MNRFSYVPVNVFYQNLRANDNPIFLKQNISIKDSLETFSARNYLTVEQLFVQETEQAKKKQNQITLVLTDSAENTKSNLNKSFNSITPQKRSLSTETSTQAKKNKPVDFLVEAALPTILSVNFCIVSLGKILVNKNFKSTSRLRNVKDGKDTKVHVFPVGYCVRVGWHDLEDPEKTATYVNRIVAYNVKTQRTYLSLDDLEADQCLKDILRSIDSGEAYENLDKSVSEEDDNLRVRFILYKDVKPVHRFESMVPSACWVKLIREVNKEREKRGLDTKGFSISGPNKLGFDKPLIKKSIQHLENYHAIFNLQ
eukprot:snap_masked-scaffold_14-processed-gene-8.29-mRNA-1 protein AED:1.00 eAED:1.00 QI:0/-1/0/0/-1/1/1/0/311